jgi:hypothetical protein
MVLQKKGFKKSLNKLCQDARSGSKIGEQGSAVACFHEITWSLGEIVGVRWRLTGIIFTSFLFT